MKRIISAATLKKFLMTLMATTVSIILTFGTSAIVDRKKQNAAKREMVMMLMYDMQETLSGIEMCDESLNDFFKTHVDIVSHPDKFAGSWAELISCYPILEYTSTTENIFRSNIETINTIGNVLFVQTVSSFYDIRRRYKEQIVDDFMKEVEPAIGQYETLADFDSSPYPFYSTSFLNAMRSAFEQCKLMMKVSDKELDKFSVLQKSLIESTTMEEEGVDDAILELQKRKLMLQEAREKGRMAL